jgi:hypothetical protein
MASMRQVSCRRVSTRTTNPLPHAVDEFVRHRSDESGSACWLLTPTTSGGVDNQAQRHAMAVPNPMSWNTNSPRTAPSARPIHDPVPYCQVSFPGCVGSDMERTVVVSTTRPPCPRAGPSTWVRTLNPQPPASSTLAGGRWVPPAKSARGQINWETA